MLKKEGEIRIPSGCAISGLISKKEKGICGDTIVESMTVMHERSNGLGGGFAGYGIYPQYKDLYALHIFYDGMRCREICEKFIDEVFEVVNLSKIPIRKTAKITNEPLIWRYFVTPSHNKLKDSQLDEKEFTARAVLKINREIDGCYVFSSGKNMGVFKAVGYPEDVGEFYRLDEYKGYSWTAHGRYPTNTPGWWGGAHPFSLLDYSIVHNGEISSYDANRRFIEMFGYKCTLKTDTEVIAYIFDYLLRHQKMKLEEAASVIAAPFWSTIETMPSEEREKLTYLRNTFGSLLVTGPFSILLGFEGGLMALNDRLKLRSMVAAEKDDMVYFASEECAIRVMEPNPDRVWAPDGGEPVIAVLEGGLE
ncbi:MAG: glutamine amidotransferase family protein [Clostridiales bacterium]|jgi:glutamate synthase domain-containing protein 1|nr:glutamine amidotransferase family protein [Clostridiales bacterium]